MKYLRLLVVIAALLVLAGCGRYGAHGRVMRANYNVSRGDFQTAIVDYLRAAEVEEFVPWISYNLGNVYHSLGESQVALEMWSAAQNAEIDDLLFGAAFNRGVYYFEQGQYQEAVAQFRFALRLSGSDVETKRNLEMSLEKLEAGEELTSTGGTTEEAEVRSGDGGRIIDYIRRKEEQQWRSNTEDVPDPGERDW